MQFSKLSSVLVLSALAFAGIRAYSQASVSENEPAYLYVNGSTGSDSHSGSSSSPLKTIQAAVNKANTNNQKKIGTKIIVASGVYRESVYVNHPWNGSSAPLTIQAASTGGAVIAGSDVLSGWTPVSGHPNTYYHSWNYNFGYCGMPSGWPSSVPSIARRTEMIFVNGAAYTQVMSESQLHTGTFYVDEGTNQILITVPSWLSISGATVEAAVRTSTITVNQRTNVVLRGLVFRHGRTCINQAAANINGSSEVLLDRVQANWNSWGGLGVNSSNHVTVQNSIASHNGGVGFSGFKDLYALYSYDESDFNNWRGAQGALYDWGMGGTKLMLMRNATVQDYYAYGNQAQGLWFDTDNKNITINNATIAGSMMAALQLEANEGPITLKSSHLCTSRSGVNVLNVEKLTMQYNTFYNNGGFGQYPGQIFVAGRPGGHVIYDWQTGQYYDLRTTGTVLTSNNFQAASSGQHVFGTYLSGSDWSDFANSLSANGNHWYDPTTSYSFMLPSAHLVNFSGWKSAVGTDYSSYWSSSSTSCSIPSQSYKDFDVNLDSESYTMTSGHVTAGVKVNNYGWGTVNLSVTGLPSNVSASFSTSSIYSGILKLNLYASKYAPNTTVPITIWAASGSRIHSVTVSVHIVPA